MQARPCWILLAPSARLSQGMCSKPGSAKAPPLTFRGPFSLVIEQGVKGRPKSGYHKLVPDRRLRTPPRETPRCPELFHWPGLTLAPGSHFF